MTAQSRAVLKTYFETGERPTQGQFADLIDSFALVSAGTSAAVTSVGLVMPNIFSVTNSPITTSGDITVALSAQASRAVFAAPASAAGLPSFRALVASDLTIDNGTWTPTLTFQTPGDLNVVYGQRDGNFMKIGRMVILNYNISGTVNYTSSSGSLLITGVPYANAMAANLHANGPLAWSGMTKAGYTDFTGQLNAGTSNIFIATAGSGVALSTITTVEAPNAAEITFRGCLVYMAAA